jgi:membrane-associated phospholipid phosphatase
VLDRYVNAFTAEWFAFFYFCYFIVLAVHTLPILLLVRHERLLGEFSFGMLFLFCTGHVLYTLVPGFGPYRAISDLLHHPLPSGFWVDTVLRTVASGGAQKDIFPSLHTAAPTFISLFSFRNRAHMPFRMTWPVIAFFAGNIVIATMFMRWHWLIDVVAGLCLALLAFCLSIAVTRFDLARRSRLALGPSWPRFEAGPLLVVFTRGQRHAKMESRQR